MENELRRTGLYAEHLALEARMAPFAGWELPQSYAAGGPTCEHQAVRAAAGLFDIDHMGQFRLSGPDADAFLNFMQTVDIRRFVTWGAHYALLPYADGGLVDDIFLYRLDDAWWMIVNAANREKDLRWLSEHAQAYAVTIEDISDDTYMLALQGPKAQAILQRLTEFDLRQLPFHTCAWAPIAGVRALLGATGYTGEYGYELFFPATQAVHVWQALLAAGKADGLLPCGLIARDTLRLEAGLPLYGHEIGPHIDPYSAGLGSFVHFAKGDFLGRDALLKIRLEGTARKLAGFEMLEKAVPREGYDVLADGVPIGQVTSGMKAPSNGQFLGLALLATPYAAVGTEFAIDIRGTIRRARVIKKPFYVPAYRK